MLVLRAFGVGGGEDGLGLPVGGLEGRGGELVLVVGLAVGLAVGLVVGLVVDLVVGLVVGLVVRRRIVGELGIQARASHWTRSRRCEGAVSREGKRRACWVHRRRSMAWLCYGSLCGLWRGKRSCDVNRGVSYGLTRTPRRIDASGYLMCKDCIEEELDDYSVVDL